jgi:hypothetical protein
MYTAASSYDKPQQMMATALLGAMALQAPVAPAMIAGIVCGAVLQQNLVNRLHAVAQVPLAVLTGVVLSTTIGLPITVLEASYCLLVGSIVLTIIKGLIQSAGADPS